MMSGPTLPRHMVANHCQCAGGEKLSPMDMLMEQASTVVSWKCGTMAIGMAVPEKAGAGTLVVFNELVVMGAGMGGMRDSVLDIDAGGGGGVAGGGVGGGGGIRFEFAGRVYEGGGGRVSRGEGAESLIVQRPGVLRLRPLCPCVLDESIGLTATVFGEIAESRLSVSMSLGVASMRTTLSGVCGGR